jgi:hypothetical protein
MQSRTRGLKEVNPDWKRDGNAKPSTQNSSKALITQFTNFDKEYKFNRHKSYKAEPQELKMPKFSKSH